MSKVSLSVHNARGEHILIDTMMDRQMGLTTHMDPEPLILLYSPSPALALVQQCQALLSGQPLLSSLVGVESQEVLAGQQSSLCPRSQLVVAL